MSALELYKALVKLREGAPAKLGGAILDVLDHVWFKLLSGAERTVLDAALPKDLS